MNNTVRILLIESNERYRLLIKQVFSLFKGFCYKLHFAASLSEAMEWLKYNNADVVLMDLSPDNLSGIRTFEETFDKYSEIPIIVLSGPDDEDMALEAVRKGAQDYIIKNELCSVPLPRIIKCSIERNLLRTKIAQISITDELTNLYNRRGFLAMTRQQLELARRLQKKIGLFFIDIDGMKEINDVFGHEQGDQSLIDTAQILREACRITDVIGRIGGDEFGISLLQEKNYIAKIEKRIRNKIELHNRFSKRKYILSVSIGKYCFNAQEFDNIQKPLEEADKVMYLEKQEKKRQNIAFSRIRGFN